MKRTLLLTRETLTELNPADLTSVVGGGRITGNGNTCPLLDCYGTAPTDPRQTCNCCTASASC